MNPKNQAWQPLDPAAGSLPPEIESALVDADSLPALVVILVDSEIDPDWGAQASLAVAKKWAASGHRVILADGCLDRPVLHEAVGVENGEGVSDLVLYGASARRFAGRVEDRLMLAPAGTPVVEVADVLKHVKWDMMIGGCREVGATLVFHVLTGTPGVEAMTERAEGVLVLAPASKDVDAILGSASGPLIAVLGPANGDAPAVAIEEEEGDLPIVEELGGPPEVAAPEVAAPEIAAPEVKEDNEAALSVEAVPGVPEDEAPPAFTVDDLPELPSSAGEAGETPDAFSVTDLGGTQYEVGDSPEVGVETADVDSGTDLEVASRADGDVEDTAEGQDDAEGEAVAVDADTALGVDGFEAGAGIGLEGAADYVEGISGPESAGAVASDGIDFGKLDFGGAEPTSTSDSLSELVVEEPSTEAEVDAAPSTPRPRYRGLARLERRRRRAVFVRQSLTGLLTILIVGGGGFAAAYYGWVTIPGITQERSYVPPPAALPGPVPQTAIMSHVLLIDLSRTIETPLSTAAALRTRLPNLLFFITPLEMEGTLQFALYVGPAYSPVEADALREPVAVVQPREDPNDWSVRDAPYAFYFGEYDTPANAQGRIQALAETLVRPCPGGRLIGRVCVDLSAGIPGGDPVFSRPAANGIPAYSLQVTYPDGRTAVRVYGGAFSDEFQAYDMGQMVIQADVGGMVLTSRRGTLPGGPPPGGPPPR